MSETYDLAPEPTPPALPGLVIWRESADELVDAALADLLIHATMAVRSLGDFHIALSGSALLDPVYRRLMYDPPLREFPWKRTHVWLSAESSASPGDPRSCFRALADWIMEHSDMPREQAHPMRPDVESGDAAYEREMAEAMSFREPEERRLDFVLLALDPRGDAPPRSESGRMVQATGAGLSMTSALISRARFVGLFGAGEGSRGIVERVARGDGEQWASVRPSAGQMKWYLDREACGM